MYLLRYAEQLGKKVALDGYSMKTNIEIAKELGYIKVKKETIIPINDIDKYPDNKVVIVCTGAQGETNAVFARIVNGTHRSIKLKKQDTIVFSSSVIPGNERSVQRLRDNLYRMCDNVIHSDIMDIHMGGHGSASDIQEVIKMADPQFFVPIYANHFFLVEAKKRAMEIGFPENKIFVLDNGNVLEFDKDRKAHVLKEKADSSYIFIDGLGVGDVGHVVLRDRQVLAADGMFVITAIIDSKTKELVGNLQVTSRGFIYVKENFDLVNETKRRVVKAIKDSTSRGASIDWKFVENNIRETVGQFLFQKTQRRPMVLPVVIEV
jgi:ribonuclease J